MNEVIEEGNETVLQFIEDFKGVGKWSDDCVEVIRRKFKNGYCYYFAQMLQLAFGRGEVCWAAPIAHIVWADKDATVYDIEGVYAGSALVFIPVRYLHELIGSYKHVEDEKVHVTKEQLIEVIRDYATDKGIEIDMEHVDLLLSVQGY